MEETLLNITNDFPEEVVLEHPISWMWFLAPENKNDQKIIIKFNKDTNKEVNPVTLKDKGKLKISTIALLILDKLTETNVKINSGGKKMKGNHLKWFIGRLKVIFKYFILCSEKNQIDHIKNSSAR